MKGGIKIFVRKKESDDNSSKHLIFTLTFLLNKLNMWHSDVLHLEVQLIITQYLQQPLVHHRNYNSHAGTLMAVHDWCGFFFFLHPVDRNLAVQCVCVWASHSEATAEGIGSSSNSKLWRIQKQSQGLLASKHCSYRHTASKSMSE